MFDNRFFKIAFSILLILLILFLWKQVHYIYEPLNSVIAVLLTPLLISILFYYLLRPIVRFLTRYLRYKGLAILITFLVIAIIIITVSYFGGSIIQRQIRDLTNLFSNYYTSIRNSLRNADNELLAHYIEKYKIEEKLSSFVARLFTGIQNNFFGFFSKITSAGTIIILIPVIVYYFLKDDHAIYHGLIGLLPIKIKKLGSAILAETDQTLAQYITGQLIIALIEGSLALVGYLIIGLPNADFSVDDYSNRFYSLYRRDPRRFTRCFNRNYHQLFPSFKGRCRPDREPVGKQPDRAPAPWEQVKNPSFNRHPLRNGFRNGLWFPGCPLCGSLLRRRPRPLPRNHEV